MKFTGLTLAVMLAMIAGGDGYDRFQRPQAEPTPSTSLGVSVPEPPNAPVRVGDNAPQFSWVGPDGSTVRLRDVLRQANALVVFAPSDEVLQSLEMEREPLADLGVVPVAILEGRSGGVKARARRLGVHYLIVPDPHRIIGSQFDVVDSRTDRSQPAWFAVDRKGIVRSEWHESLPTQGWLKIAASALALPLPDATIPARTR